MFLYKLTYYPVVLPPEMSKEVEINSQYDIIVTAIDFETAHVAAIKKLTESYDSYGEIKSFSLISLERTEININCLNN